MALLFLMLKISENKNFFISQNLRIRALLKKNNNFKSNKNDKCNNNMFIRKSGVASFHTSTTKIAFVQLKKAFIEAPILYYFELN